MFTTNWYVYRVYQLKVLEESNPNISPDSTSCLKKSRSRMSKQEKRLLQAYLNSKRKWF